MIIGHDSLKTLSTIEVQGQTFHIYSLEKAQSHYPELKKLPFSLKIVLENLLRFEDGTTVKIADIEALQQWVINKTSNHEIAYRPARVLMQDFTGVPAVVDLAAMRDAMLEKNGDAHQIAPLNTVDLVIDHSVMVDVFGSKNALSENAELEMERNQERYEFLRWGQRAFNNFRVVPPGTGICHQVNLEYLAKTIWTAQHKDKTFAF